MSEVSTFIELIEDRKTLEYIGHWSTLSISLYPSLVIYIFDQCIFNLVHNLPRWKWSLSSTTPDESVSQKGKWNFLRSHHLQPQDSRCQSSLLGPLVMYTCILALQFWSPPCLVLFSTPCIIYSMLPSFLIPLPSAITMSVHVCMWWWGGTGFMKVKRFAGVAIKYAKIILFSEFVSHFFNQKLGTNLAWIKT